MRTITLEQWQTKQHHGYASIASGEYGIPKGTRCILTMDKKTGATCLEAVKVIGLDADAVLTEVQS